MPTGHRRESSGECPAILPSRLDVFKTHLQQLVSHDSQRVQPVFHHVDAGLFLHLQDFITQAPQPPLFVRVTGASASGKTFYKDCWETILQNEARLQAHPNLVASLEQDNYYKPNDHLRREMGEATFFQVYDLDHPDSLDLHKAADHLQALKNGKSVHIPRYTWDGVSQDNAIAKHPARIIFFEGLHALHHPNIRSLPGLNVFVEAPETTLRQRWTKRATERLIPEAEQRIFYNRVMTRYQEHVAPNREHAHLILNGEATKPDIEQTLKVLSNLMLTLLDTAPLNTSLSSQ